MDFTISGQVNRALVVSDTDAGTSAGVQDNGESSTRVRATGSTELMDGNTVSIQFEYEVGGSHDRTAAAASAAGVPVAGSHTFDDGLGGTGLNLRHANVQYGGAFGKVTLGQGSEAGDGSQYSDTTGVVGIGHGSLGLMGDYFGSLDSGGRVNMVRYDTPAVGPVSAAVSVGNGDRVSALLKLNSEVAGSTFGAQLGTLQVGSGSSSIGASFGSTLASGLTISGAWAKGSDMKGMTEPATGMLVEAIPAHFRSVDIVTATYMLDSDTGTDGVETGTFDTHMNLLRTRITDGAVANADEAAIADGELAKKLKRDLFTMAGAPTMAMGCNLAEDPDQMVGAGPTTTSPMCGERMYPATAGEDTRVAAVNHIVDPSYFQVEIGYIFGNTGVAVSWYQSSDFVRDGSEGTRIGIGATHNLPKAGAQIYTSVENFSVTPTAGATSVDGTQFMIGTRVSF